MQSANAQAFISRDEATPTFRNQTPGRLDPTPGSIDQQIKRFLDDLQTARRDRDRARNALHKVRIDALFRLAAAAEFKDNDTGAHVLRMGHFSALIAAACGMDTDYCETILYASRMHDIGKIGIPDAILQKPGKLTPEEWTIMKKHPEIGAALLKDADNDLYRMSAEIALSHHEKYDGTGYPYSVAGEDIPLSGRIVAVADFFDAVTMDRCYRPAMSDEAALALLREGRGAHFDPKVIDAFFDVVDHLIALRTQINRGETPPLRSQGSRAPGEA